MEATCHTKTSLGRTKRTGPFAFLQVYVLRMVLPEEVGAQTTADSRLSIACKISNCQGSSWSLRLYRLRGGRRSAISVNWNEIRFSLPLMSLRAYLRESLYDPRLSPPSLYRLLRVAASVLRTIFTVSDFSSLSLLFEDFLSFLSFLDFLSDFFSSFFPSFLAFFSRSISASEDLKSVISSKAQRISRASASLLPKTPWRRSQTARWSILIMRWIFPLVVSQEVSWSTLRLLRLESFSRSRTWSFLIFSAAFDALMVSAVDFFFSFFLPLPLFLALLLAAAASAAFLVSSFSVSIRRRSFSSSHF
mmetsp:Transcript_3439/g.7479  ORF Transcript_3439/g.7479 Transcript_3439/m.7479 type:complete len:305 (-) Transcript_3439:412-1326(-)